MQFVGVAGLPRAGSTLLCQLLAEHPDIHCEGHSSPLCHTLLNIRRVISDDQFFLAQLDTQFDTTYGHLQTALSGYLQGWYAGATKPVVVDKNRGWLQSIEFLLQLQPDAKLLVPIRELGQIYGSIEAQHQKTILVDFIDHLADFDRMGRADQLFAKTKSIGAPLAAIQGAQDLPEKVRQRLFFVRFEDLMAKPVETMKSVYRFMGLSEYAIDPENLKVRPGESDSHYRYKYRHKQQAQMRAPHPHAIPDRIQKQIESVNAWYYKWFYPHMVGALPLPVNQS